MIVHGDCLDVMAAMEPESVDAVVTDPPYGLGFMGKAWDAGAGPADSPMRRRPEVDAVNAGMSRQGGRQWAGLDGQRRQARDARSYGAWCEQWAAGMLRVAKPSAYLLAFGGTRTVHRMTVAIEDAGWIIRDMLVWAYASGFPKSKASLKPAWEPIVMARKPGPLRELAIDACRIGVDGGTEGATAGPSLGILGDGLNGSRSQPVPGLGRWPANLVLTDPIFDGGWDGVVGGGETASGALDRSRIKAPNLTYGVRPENLSGTYEPDSGTYSRFFLIPKADRADREPVLGGLPAGFAPTMGNGIGGREHDPENARAYRANVHPTVKPTELMRHLVRLVTPTGGIVLDPFAGSGSTLLAAEMEGFEWIGIEKEAEYVAIAEARLNGTQRGLGLPA
jgi:site-specific DNA-methyltransferase (adenine-specific)